ncbi:hypothetical protein GCM10020000_00120 [Streptomyces olivoverticillatus]
MQNEYNVMRRAHEALVEKCAADGIAFMAFFPLGTYTLQHDKDPAADTKVPQATRLEGGPLETVAQRLNATPLPGRTRLAPAPLPQHLLHPRHLHPPPTSKKNIAAASLTLTPRRHAHPRHPHHQLTHPGGQCNHPARPQPRDQAAAHPPPPHPRQPRPTPAAPQATPKTAPTPLSRGNSSHRQPTTGCWLPKARKENKAKRRKGTPMPATADPILELPYGQHPDPEAFLHAAMRWHFSPETGSPFWLNQAPRLGFDPLTDIRTFTDLARFPNVANQLRDIPARDLIPPRLRTLPRITGIYDSGGTTGAPKRVVMLDEWLQMLLAHSSAQLDAHGVPPQRQLAHGRPLRPPTWSAKPSSNSSPTAAASPTPSTSTPRWVKKLIARGEKNPKPSPTPNTSSTNSPTPSPPRTSASSCSPRPPSNASPTATSSSPSSSRKSKPSCGSAPNSTPTPATSTAPNSSPTPSSSAASATP